MAWLENIVNFVKGGIDDVKKLWINSSQKVSGMAFNADEFYDKITVLPNLMDELLNK